MPDCTKISHNHQSGRLSAILKAHGAGFVLVRSPGSTYQDWRTGEQRTAKGKEPLGAGWQRHPKSLSDAGKWAQGGGNVGLLGGHNNLILLDADANADQVEAADPRLRDTVRIFRRNAPDRRKWIVRIVGTLPPSKKAHGVLEVLAAGTQGVIFGRHDSGASIEYDGAQIVTLTADDIRRLWHTLTGDELGHTHRHEEAGPPDAAAVQRGMTLAETVLAAGDLTHAAWQPYENGRKAVLHRCPFNPPDDPHADDEAAVIIVGHDGRIGATCHHARCQERIHQHGGSGWALLKEIAGYRPAPPSDLAHVRTVVDYLREWIRRTDLAEHVPLTKQAENGYRTRDTDTDTLDAILDIAHEHGRLTGLLLSWRIVRKGTGLGVQAAGKALDRAQPWFVVEEPTAERKPGQARRFAIHSALIAWAEEQIEFAQIARGMSDRGDLVDQDKTRAIYAKSPLVTHRTRDAFTASQRPITLRALKVRPRIAEKRNEIAAALIHNRQVDRRMRVSPGGAPIEPHVAVPEHDYLKHYRRRLEALFPSAGRAVLRMIDALATETADGQADRRTLRTLLNVSPSSLSRMIARAVELGLVDADRRMVVLHQQWRELVDAFEPLMPTAGRSNARVTADADATIHYAELLLEQPDLTPQEERRLRRRIRIATETKQQIAALEAPDLAHRHADIDSPPLSDWLARQRLAERHAQARIDLAAERRADDWQLPQEVHRLRREGLSKRDAWRMLEMAGWRRAEVAGVMAVCWSSQVPA